MIFLELFLTFLQIGALTFGGGYAMLPLMQQEVLAHKWLTESQLLDFIAVAESTPGPVAINMATYIGVEKAGLLGAVCATLGVVLPSFLIILLVARFYEKYKNSFVVKSCLTGLRPVVVGLIASAVISLGMGVFFADPIGETVYGFSFFASIVIFGITVFLSFKKKSPILLILLAAVLGIASGYADLYIF